MPPNPTPSVAAAEVPPPESSMVTKGQQAEVVDVKSEEEEEDMDTSCGCGPVRWPCLQVFLKPAVFLLFISLLALFQSMIVVGYSSAILTTIEQRYNFQTSELGLIVSSYDFASVLAGVVVSYYGDRYCRPKWLSRGAFVMSIGALLWILPFLVRPEYNPFNDDSQNTTDPETYYKLCKDAENKLSSSNQSSAFYNQSKSTTSYSSSTLIPDIEMCMANMGSKLNTWALPVFMIAFMIVGFGASPVWTLGPTYLYDNTPRKTYPIYAGILYSMGALGPAVGFVLSAATLQLYVTPWNVPEGLTDSSPGWVGAWWIGFLTIAGLLMLVSIPLVCYPKALPKDCSKHNKEEAIEPKEKENPDEIPVSSSMGNNIKEFPQHLWSLVSNPVWLFITLALCSEQGIGVGFSRYIAKYLETVFFYTASSANIITGAVLIPAAALGVVCGGLVMRKLTLNTRDLTLLLLTVNFVPLALMCLIIFIDCDQIRVTKISDVITYSSVEISDGGSPLLCQVGCNCEKAPYAPVCGADGQTFTSACAAGCQLFNADNQSFSSCACVNASYTGTQEVFSGPCSVITNCPYAPVFFTVLFLSVFITTGGQTPILLITLRSVNQKLKSFSLGVQNFLVQLLVYLPAPIYFGKIFDSQCINRKLSFCETEGACVNYNRDTLRLVFMGAGVAFKILTAISLFIAYMAARRKEKMASENNTTDQNQVPEMTVSTVTAEFSKPTTNDISRSTRL